MHSIKISSRFCLSFISAVLFSFALKAQSTGSLRGFVTDSTNGEAVIYANVVVAGTLNGAPTNTKGYYYIPAIPAGKQTVIFSHVNYKPKEITVTIRANQITELSAALTPKNIELQEVSIIGRNTLKPTETNLGLEKISAKEIEMIPIGAEPDVFRALQTTAGVTTTGDVSAHYYVRGGAGDQNLVLLNGATIYNPFHALGIFSVIDPEMISAVEFYKGGFPTKYGGRLSSILNIITKDGNKNSYHGTLAASLLSGKASVEGPIPHGSFIVTGRKSYYAEILKKYLNDQEAPFDFYDMSFKANYSNPDLLNNGKFVLFGFTSDDAVKNNNPLMEDYDVKNNVLGINWNQVWASPLFSTVNISYSGFRAEVNPNLSQSKYRMNRLNDITADFNFTYIYQNKDELEFGLQNKMLDVKLTQQNLFGTTTDFNQNGWDMTGYVNYRFYRWEKVGFEIGTRVKFVALSILRPFFFEPRLSIHYLPFPFLSFKASIGRYSQEVISLSNENEVISIFQPWVIVPKGVAAPESSDLSLGVDAYLNDQLEISLTGYYKYITDLTDVNEQKYTPQDYDFINVNGKSYGMEFVTKYQSQKFFLNLNYSLGWTYQINGNLIYVPKYDIRHTFNILLGYNFGNEWTASAVWSLRSGMPFTPIAGFYDRMPINNVWGDYVFEPYQPVIYWGDRNSYRLPYYHRLDISVSKRFQFYFTHLTFEGSILNIYNRKNIFYFDKDTGKITYMLPFFPSVSLKIEI